MKVSVIITTLLVAQVSASFFDVFQGAVLSVQNSFGKLLSDVVTDVKETVDCTILAVEHVLSLSHDATTRYYHKCGSETNKTDSVSDAKQDASLPKVEVTLNLPNNEEYLQKVIPAEIDARINDTLSKVLGNFKPHDNVLSIEKVLAKESEQLAGVSVLMKKELDKLSNEVTKDLKKIKKQRDSESSVDTILQEIKVLEKREQNAKNVSEAKEIHLVIGQVLGKLDAIEATEATENFKLEEILKDLESNSNNSLVGIRHQLEEWKEEESRHLSEIKSKIEEHDKLTDHLGPFNSHESNHTQPVLFNMDINKDDIETNENSQEISSYNTTQVKETLDNSTSTRTIGDSYDNFLLVANSSSSSQNYKFNELNDTAMTSTIHSSIESPLENVIMHRFKNPYAYEFSELTTSATIQNNITRDNINVTVTNTTLEVIDRAHVKETVQPVQLIPDSDKQQSLASNEPNFLPINEYNLNETVIISTTTTDKKQTDTTDTKSTSGSGKEKSLNLAANNNAVVTSATQNTEVSTTLESFKNQNFKYSAKLSTIASMMAENASVNASNSENESFTTPDHIESTETMTPSTPTSLNASTLVTETIIAIKSSTATVNEEFSTVTAKIVTVNDSINTVLPSSLKNLENTSIIENVLPEETAVAFGGDHPTTELSVKMANNVSNVTLIMSPSITTVENSPVSETIQHELSTITTEVINGNYSKNAMMTTDPSSMLNTTPVSKTIKPEDPKASGKETSSIDLNEYMTTTAFSTMEGSDPPVSGTIHPVDNNTSAGNDESSETIIESTTSSLTKIGSETTNTGTLTTIISTAETETIPAVDTTTLFTSSTTGRVNYLNNALETTDPSSILNITAIRKTLETEEPTATSDKEKSSMDSNVTLKTTTSSTIENTPVSETIQPEEKSTSADNGQSSEATTESTSASITYNDSETTIKTTTIIGTSTSESETIQAVDTTTLFTSEGEYLTSTANRLTETPNTADEDEDDDDLNTTVMSTPEAITESISEENILAPEHEEPLPSTTSLPKASPSTLMDTDSNSDDIITSTPYPLAEMTTVSEATVFTENTTFTEDEEPSLLSTSSETIPDAVEVENNDSIVTTTSKTENTDSTVVIEIIQTVETTAASEEQELSSTFTQSAMNEMVTSTELPPTEMIPTSESVMAYRNEEDSRKPPRLEANTLRTPKVLNRPNLNLIVKRPPLTIAPSVNREWLTPNEVNQQNYNTDGEQRNIYEFNGPISLNDRLLQTSKPIINSEVPMYGQAAMPPITRGLFNDAPKHYNRLSPDYPDLSASLFGPEKNIFRNEHLIPNTLRDPTGPPRMYPSYVAPSQHPIRPPYSFDSAPENTYRQLSLTTHRPARTAAQANNKNPSFDYDSFFHLRDPEARHRALKEARQLMANSKRSDRIINNIMKNKNKFKARSIFG